MSIKQTVFNYLDSIKSPSNFSGWELQQKLKSITGKNTYPSTLLKYAREYADISGSTLKCLDVKESQYSFCRQFSLGNSIRD